MRKILMILLVLALVTFTTPVVADIAPPDQPPGANPVPGSDVTEVRMVAENVLIEVQAKSPAGTLGTARVTADFNMRNLGNQAEKMAVRFPTGASDGRGGTPEITDMVVKVNGKSVALRSTTGEDPNYGGGSVPWVEFDVSFPAGQDVNISVSYTLEAVGEMPYIWFNYIFSTGAGWKGTIGKADLTARFPYDVSELNVMPCSVDEISNCTTRGGKFNGKEITWHFDDFEPGYNDNFTLYIAAPSEWTKVLNETLNVQNRPMDGEAWGRLGKAYKALVFSPHGRRGFRDFTLLTDPGAQELFGLSDEAYAKAVELKPDDALWHAGYADLLGYYSYFAGFEAVETIPLKVKALQEINRALELKPDDPTVQTIALDLSFFFPDGMVQVGEKFDFPWLTQTPVATATDIIPVIVTETPVPEVQPTATLKNTPVPEITPTLVSTSAASAPAASTKSPLCGSVILVPLVFVSGLIFQRRNSTNNHDR